MFQEAKSKDLHQVYVADDDPRNEEIFRKVAAEYDSENFALHFWLVKDDSDPKGNMDAYSAWLVDRLRSEKEGSSMVILDLDNTTINTTATLDRAAFLAHSRIEEARLT